MPDVTPGDPPDLMAALEKSIADVKAARRARQVEENKMDQPFDTVKDLTDFLSSFPEDTPITVTYDGRGRIHGVASYDGDRLALVAVFPASDAWLAGHGLPQDTEETER